MIIYSWMDHSGVKLVDARSNVSLKVARIQSLILKSIERSLRVPVCTKGVTALGHSTKTWAARPQVGERPNDGRLAQRVQ
jgi:hypothetical protein